MPLQSLESTLRYIFLTGSHNYDIKKAEQVMSCPCFIGKIESQRSQGTQLSRCEIPFLRNI